MGSLLSRYESFIWNDVAINRSVELQNYNSALGSARAKSDSLFRPNKIFDGDVPSNIFYVMYFDGKMSYDDLKLHYNWLTVDDYQVLIMLGNIVGNPTNQCSNTWNEFSNEFPGEHISLIGLQDQTCTDPLVYCKVTHTRFHSDNVATFDFDQQKKNFKYFKDYFVPKLKLESSVINSRIAAGQFNSGIIRLDDPPVDRSGKPVHGQKIHVHLIIGGKKVALNIDGTWKHEPKNTTVTIPSAICAELSDLGFKIPDEYYE